MKKIFTILLLAFAFATLSFGQRPSSQIGTDGGSLEKLKLYIPNAFTPNADGKNDVFFIENSNFATFEFNVFDRWGTMLYESTDPNFRWNGQAGGRRVMPGVYVFVFNGVTNDGLKIKRSGTISVIY